MALSDRQLMKIISSEKYMLQYLKERKENPSDIDPIVWSIHFTVLPNKRMPVLNSLYDEYLMQTKILYSFLPYHLIRAKVFKRLNIPYSITTMRGKSLVDDVKPKKLKYDNVWRAATEDTYLDDFYFVKLFDFIMLCCRTSRITKLMKCYNVDAKKTKIDDSGLYSFDEEWPSELESYACFRSVVNISRERSRLSPNRNQKSVGLATPKPFRSYSRFSSNRMMSSLSQDCLFDSLLHNGSPLPKRRKNDVQISKPVPTDVNVVKKISERNQSTESDEEWNEMFNTTTEKDIIDALNRATIPLDVIYNDSIRDTKVDQSPSDLSLESSISKNTIVSPVENINKAPYVNQVMHESNAFISPAIENMSNSNKTRETNDQYAVLPYVSPPPTSPVRRRYWNNLTATEPSKESFTIKVQVNVHRQCTSNDYYNDKPGVTVEKSVASDAASEVSSIIWSPKYCSTPNISRNDDNSTFFEWSPLSSFMIQRLDKDTTIKASAIPVTTDSSKKSEENSNHSSFTVDRIQEAMNKESSKNVESKRWTEHKFSQDSKSCDANDTGAALRSLPSSIVENCKIQKKKQFDAEKKQGMDQTKEIEKGDDFTRELAPQSIILNDVDDEVTNLKNVDESVPKKVCASRITNLDVNFIKAGVIFESAMLTNIDVLAESESDFVYSSTPTTDWSSSAKDVKVVKSSNDKSAVRNDVFDSNPGAFLREIISDEKEAFEEGSVSGHSTPDVISKPKRTLPSKASAEILNNSIFDEITDNSDSSIGHISMKSRGSDVTRVRYEFSDKEDSVIDSLVKSVRSKHSKENKSAYTMSSSDSDDNIFVLNQTSPQYEHISLVDLKNQNSIHSTPTVYPNSDSDSFKSSNIEHSVSSVQSNSDSNIFCVSATTQALDLRKNNRKSRQLRQYRFKKNLYKTSYEEKDKLLKMQRKCTKLTSFKDYRIAKKSFKAQKSKSTEKKGSDISIFSKDDQLKTLNSGENNEIFSKSKFKSVIISPSSDSGSQKTTSSFTSKLLSAGFEQLSLDNAENSAPLCKKPDLNSKYAASSEELILDDSDLEYIGIPKPTEDIDEDLLEVHSWAMLTNDRKRSPSAEVELDFLNDDISRSEYSNLKYFSKKDIASLRPNEAQSRSNLFSAKSKKIASSQSRHSSEDEYESDQLTEELEKQLANMSDLQSPRKTQKKEDDTISVVSRDFNNEVRQLIMADAQPTKQFGRSTIDSTQVLTASTPSSTKTNSTHFSKMDSQSSLNYKDIMWESYPDSIETALTTSNEKLNDVRANIKKRLVETTDDNVLKLIVSNRESCKSSSSDNLSDWSWYEDN